MWRAEIWIYNSGTVKDKGTTFSVLFLGMQELVHSCWGWVGGRGCIMKSGWIASSTYTQKGRQNVWLHGAVLRSNASLSYPRFTSHMAFHMSTSVSCRVTSATSKCYKYMCCKRGNDTHAHTYAHPHTQLFVLTLPWWTSTVLNWYTCFTFQIKGQDWSIHVCLWWCTYTMCVCSRLHSHGFVCRGVHRQREFKLAVQGNYAATRRIVQFVPCGKQYLRWSICFCSACMFVPLIYVALQLPWCICWRYAL